MLLAADVPARLGDALSFGLNLLFLALAALLVWRFVRTGGLPMLRMMTKPM
jgi:hypothetical protein